MEKRQYKHRKTGQIAEMKSAGDWYTIEDRYGMPKEYIEGTQDWELIAEEKEPEYTILQFEKVKGVTKSDRWWNLQGNGEYASAAYSYTVPLDSMMNIGCSVKDGSFRIYQIRRNSDKSVWTVGDKYVSFQVPLLGIRTIEKFVIDDESIGIRAVEAISADPITTSLKYLTVLVKPTWVIESFSTNETPTVAQFWRVNDERYSTEKDWVKGGGQVSLSAMLHDGSCVDTGEWVIHSVRADKNSPVIAINDWITAEYTHMGNTPMQVEGFAINDKNNLLIKTRQFRTHGVGIENCRKVDAPVEKRPLFTTEDGVDIYNRQHPVLYWLEINSDCTGTDDANTIYNPDIVDYKYWASAEKRKQYIDTHRKKSTEQIAKVGEYGIGKGGGHVVKVLVVKPTKYQVEFCNGERDWYNHDTIRLATQEEINRDWGKKNPVECDPGRKYIVKLTEGQIEKLQTFLQDGVIYW